MRHLDPAVRIDAADAVHQMRVAVRRLRSTLATYRRLLDREVTEPIRDELKWLGGVLGAVRDAEVIRSYLAGVVDEQPPSLVIGRVGLRIEATTTKQHDDAHRQALAELSSVRYLDLMAALEHLTEAIRGERAKRPARAQLRKEIRRAHRRMRRHLDAALAGDRPSEQEFHDVRKAAKRARYAAETALPVYGKRAAKYADTHEGGTGDARRATGLRRRAGRAPSDRRRRDGRGRVGVHLRPDARSRGATRT